jgi:hypothetical protein
MYRLITFVFPLGFELHLFPEDTLGGAAFWTAVLEAMFIIPVREETIGMEVMVAMCPKPTISLRHERRCTSKKGILTP